MDLSALAGNPRLKELLSRREEGRGLSHAYILSGPVGSGRHTLARLLSAAMVCASPAGRRPCYLCGPCKKALNGIHPDVIPVTGPGEGKPITVDQIRAIRADAHIRPNEGERKVYVLEGADRMNDSAQNAMLKLLEEGPAYAAFLLLAENAGGLLQTVRSRCEDLTLAPVPLEEAVRWLSEKYPYTEPQEVRNAAINSQGFLGRAVDELDWGEAHMEAKSRAVYLADGLEKQEADLFQVTMILDKLSREELNRTLEALEEELARRTVAQNDRRRLMKAVDLVKQLRAAAQFNVNGGQVAGWLCAAMYQDELRGSPRLK